MRSNFITFKIIAIAILVALFWIGLLFITSLVSERQDYQRAFLKEIAQNNAPNTTTNQSPGRTSDNQRISSVQRKAAEARGGEQVRAPG